VLRDGELLPTRLALLLLRGEVEPDMLMRDGDVRQPLPFLPGVQAMGLGAQGATNAASTNGGRRGARHGAPLAGGSPCATPGRAYP